MSHPLTLTRFSLGTGDRFGLQGPAQLAAIQEAARHGVELAIVWNKSYREHTIVGTTPQDVRTEADDAVRAAGWTGPYHVDADHINLDKVAPFLAPSDFFTIDVAEAIGKKDDEQAVAAFVETHLPLSGTLVIPGIDGALTVTRDHLYHIADTYLCAIRQAAAIYRHILAAKTDTPFITEVSMDETDRPQSPIELFFILAGLAEQKVPVQTIAPKFTGRFNKGIDYRGDVDQFNREFAADVCVLKEASRRFGLPAELKLSVHTGSDKFSIYPGMGRTLAAHGAGVHLKTAGTTWLEELIGLAVAGGEALSFVRQVYRLAYDRFDELCRPYATVIDIDRQALPSNREVETWPGDKLAAVIRHDQSTPDYDSNVRQLLHVSFKIAAEHGDQFRSLVRQHREVVAEQVRDNLLKRHIMPLFGGLSVL
ncbi:MAG: hypothetical protein IH612_18390 [Desulfofustis sp.]|nr:hypothetical protein [Desulfofustis sp.]